MTKSATKANIKEIKESSVKESKETAGKEAKDKPTARKSISNNKVKNDKPAIQETKEVNVSVINEIENATNEEPVLKPNEIVVGIEEIKPIEAKEIPKIDIAKEFEDKYGNVAK